MKTAIAFALLVVSVACTPSQTGRFTPRGSSSAQTSPMPTGSSFSTQPGPLPPEGFFSTHCLYSHSARDDPIVFPGAAGKSHLHDFFGNGATAATSTAESLRTEPRTTCGTRADRAAYWTPAFYMNGARIQPPFQNEYWFDGGFSRVHPVPLGLSMVAGDSHATAEQPTGTVYYFCGGTHGPVHSPHLPRPYDCSSFVRGGDASGVIAVVVFPQCWDGHLPAGNGTADVAYPVSPGKCPPGFPIPLPRLEEHLHLGIVNPLNPDGTVALRAASGPYYTLHGDFMNAWVPSALARLIQDCINGHVQCLGRLPGSIDPGGSSPKR